MCGPILRLIRSRDQKLTIEELWVADQIIKT
jgi:hypothetical protein